MARIARVRVRREVVSHAVVSGGREVRAIVGVSGFGHASEG